MNDFRLNNLELVDMELNIDKFKLKFNKKYEKFYLYNEIPKKFSSYLSV